MTMTLRYVGRRHVVQQELMLAGKVDGVSPDVATSAATLAAIKQFASKSRPSICRRMIRALARALRGVRSSR